MDQSNGCPTPMVSSCNLFAHVSSPLQDDFEYRSVVGALQYIVITRPDIAFAANKVCHFMHKPLDHHFKAVKRMLRYLQATIDFGL